MARTALLARRRSASALLGALLLTAPGAGRAELPLETVGEVARLPAPARPRWIWAADPVTQRSALVDLESGRMLGQLDGGFGVTTLAFAPSREEIYLPATYYSRGSRGIRTDVVTIYGATTLAPLGEVVMPGKRALNPLSKGNVAISDDERFLAVFEMDPSTSLGIVDLAERRPAGRIPIPGCGLVYAAGPRRFLSVCGDGSLLVVEVDERGGEARKWRTPTFFDAQRDPLTEKAVRRGMRWHFVSFEGRLHTFDAGAEPPRAEPSWSLFSDAERAQNWRVGGYQHLAIHETTGRLFALVHRGPVDTHKDPGNEAWVYDLDTQQRLQRIALRNPGFTYLGVPLAFGADWPWPLNGLYDFLMDHLVPNLGIDQIEVTQDEQPLLVSGVKFSGALALHDALSGEFRGRLATGNMTTLQLQSPWRPPTR